jgi:hypothetical protein
MVYDMFHVLKLDNLRYLEEMSEMRNQQDGI